jgi:hypothetical protein
VINQYGEYISVAGTLIGLFFKTPIAQEVSQFLVQLGADVAAGMGSVGPIRLGNESFSGTITTPTPPASQNAGTVQQK